MLYLLLLLIDVNVDTDNNNKKNKEIIKCDLFGINIGFYKL